MAPAGHVTSMDACRRFSFETVTRAIGSRGLSRLRRTWPRASWSLTAMYDAFGFFGSALQEKMGIFHASSLTMVPKAPNASYIAVVRLRTEYAERRQSGVSARASPDRGRGVVPRRLPFLDRRVERLPAVAPAHLGFGRTVASERAVPILRCRFSTRIRCKVNEP